jgi:hypothetical protein
MKTALIKLTRASVLAAGSRAASSQSSPRNCLDRKKTIDRTPTELLRDGRRGPDMIPAPANLNCWTTVRCYSNSLQNTGVDIQISAVLSWRSQRSCNHRPASENGGARKVGPRPGRKERFCVYRSVWHPSAPPCQRMLRFIVPSPLAPCRANHRRLPTV